MSSSQPPPPTTPSSCYMPLHKSMAMSGINKTQKEELTAKSSTNQSMYASRTATVDTSNMSSVAVASTAASSAVPVAGKSKAADDDKKTIKEPATVASTVGKKEKDGKPAVKGKSKEVAVKRATETTQSPATTKKSATKDSSATPIKSGSDSAPETEAPAGSGRTEMKSEKAASDEKPSLISSSLIVPDDVRASSYFHGLLPRDDVEGMLEKDGDYILRATDHNGKRYIALSVMVNGKAAHILVNRKTTGWRLHDEKYIMAKVTDLCEYHRANQISPVKAGGLLKRPISRKCWELLHDDVKIGERLGGGAFGDVFKGVLMKRGGKQEEVAIKTLKIQEDPTEKTSDKKAAKRAAALKEIRSQFMQEARLMRKLQHKNIVRVIGVAAQEEPMMLVMEILPGGSLLSKLRHDGKKLSSNQHVKFLLDAADGMRYLESKAFIHRDLAARNCLLSRDHEVKISDFGLSVCTRNKGEAKKGDGHQMLPIKWLAPEVLTNLLYSIASDVWAYGILIHEVFSNGKEPYVGMTNRDVRDSVVNKGYRMEAPTGTPEEVAKVQKDCFAVNPDNRPSFKVIHKRIKKVYVPQ